MSPPDGEASTSLHRPHKDVQPGAADTQWDECSEGEIWVARAGPGTGSCGEVWGGCPQCECDGAMAGAGCVCVMCMCVCDVP